MASLCLGSISRCPLTGLLVRVSPIDVNSATHVAFIDRNAPAWTTNLLDLYIGTIDVFSSYQNVLGYHIGNEVVIAANGTGAAAFVKAAARDVKAYLYVRGPLHPGRNLSVISCRNSKSSTALVGYAAVDADSTWLDPLANYLTCDPSGNGSGASSIDIFGLNN